MSKKGGSMFFNISKYVFLFCIGFLTMGSVSAKNIPEKALNAKATRKIAFIKPDYKTNFLILNQEKNGDGSREAHLRVELLAEHEKVSEPVPTGWAYQPVPTGWLYEPVPTGWLYQPIPTGWLYAPVPTGWTYDVEWKFLNGSVTERKLAGSSDKPLGDAVFVSEKSFLFPHPDTYILRFRFYLRPPANKARVLSYERSYKVTIEN